LPGSALNVVGLLMLRSFAMRLVVSRRGNY
jgi:hypothetical protein